MKWSYLIETDDPVAQKLSAREEKAWIAKFLQEFAEHQKYNQHMLPKAIIEVLALEHRHTLNTLAPMSVLNISKGLEKALVANGIDPHWPVPALYQEKALEIYKTFRKLRNQDKEKKRSSDALLFKIIFAKTFNIRPVQASMDKALIDKSLKLVVKKLLGRLVKLGYDVKDDEPLGITPAELAKIRLR